jgi:integrase
MFKFKGSRKKLRSYLGSERLLFTGRRPNENHRNLFKSFLPLPVAMLEIATLYISSRQLSPAYEQNLVRTAKRAYAFGITADNIDDALVNRFILSLSSETSLGSRANIRRELLTLWRFGFITDVIDTSPKNVTKVYVKQDPVEAWSHKQLSQLLATAKKDKTKIGGVSKMRICDYMPAWIRIGYETGMRHGDILTLNAKEIRNGCIVKVASKTSKQLVRKIEEPTLVLANDLIAQSADGTLFRWFLTRRRSFVAMKNFLERHKFEGSGKFLRRSCATAIANDSPAKASAYLQHSNERLLKHYVDQSLLDVPDGPPPIK